jgi:hypothetical protein
MGWKILKGSDDGVKHIELLGFGLFPPSGAVCYTPSSEAFKIYLYK